jgi:hypothetical protein
VALLLAHGLVLLMAPVYLTHYSAYLTVPLSLTLGAAAAVVSGELRASGVRRLHRGAAAATVAALLLLAIGTAAHPLGRRFPGERLATAVPAAGCVRADAPIALIQLNVLSRDLRRGCDVPVDFTGLTYDRLGAEPGGRHAGASDVERGVAAVRTSVPDVRRLDGPRAGCRQRLRRHHLADARHAAGAGQGGGMGRAGPTRQGSRCSSPDVTRGTPAPGAVRPIRPI